MRCYLEVDLRGRIVDTNFITSDILGSLLMARSLCKANICSSEIARGDDSCDKYNSEE